MESPGRPQSAPQNNHQTVYANPNIDLDEFTLQDLLALRSEVEKRLPSGSIRDIDLTKEVVLQFRAVQELQGRVVLDPEVAANQKAQVANSTSAILAQLTKLQTELYTVERLKRIEMALIEALNELPEADQRRFFTVYEAILGSSGA